MWRSSAAIRVLAALLILRVLACPIAAGHGSPLEGRFIVRVCAWPAATPDRGGVAVWTASRPTPDPFKARRPLHPPYGRSLALGPFPSGRDGLPRNPDASARSRTLRC